MKKFSAILLAAFFALGAGAQDTAPLRLVQAIPLPNVEGRIDHMAFDVKGQRLFVAALGNNTVEVLDLRTGKHIHSISGLYEPQGVGYVPEFNKIFVANGGDGTCQVFDGTSFQLVSSVKFAADADNVRYDASTQRVYVGYGAGALGIIDAKDNKLVGDIHLAGHPESFQLEKSGPIIYVNVPTAQQVAVVDRNKQAVIATWPLADFRSNFPMTLNETDQRLFVGTRHPARVVVLDTKTGRMDAALPCGEDTDDLFYDAARRCLYVSCGAGLINVFEQSDADQYREIAKIPTAPGARTSFWVPELGRLFVAVPHRGNQKAAILVFEAHTLSANTGKD